MSYCQILANNTYCKGGFFIAEKDERSTSAVEGVKNMPKIPDCWELRQNGCAQGADQVLEEGVWVSLVDIALEALHVLAGLPIENFNVPVITIVRDGWCL